MNVISGEISVVSRTCPMGLDMELTVTSDESIFYIEEPNRLRCENVLKNEKKLNST